MAENYNVGNVEIQVKTAAEKAISSLDVLISKLNSVNASVKNIAAINNITNKAEKAVQQTTKSLKKLDNQTQKVSKTTSSFFSLGKMTMVLNYARRIANVFSDIVAKGIDFIETTNLFQVSMGDMYYQALKFNNELSRTFGMNQEQLMRYQATFKNMLSALGSLSSELSYNLSEVLTKSALDYASLFNTTVEQAMTAYKAVLAGQIRPIRSVSGFDVAEQTIFVKAQELGINKTVRQLSQLEKRLLRIIVLNEQMFNLDVVGDFAQTIEQPAQQLRILVAQLQETARWISITFMETISSVLPYVNGFIMTIKEVVKSLAYFGSWRLSKVRAGVDPLTELTEEAEGAGEAVDNLQKKLFSFDKFEVLGGSEQSSLFGVDQRIIDALQDYDNLMGDIKMRANEISESLMRWLGYIPVEELDDAGEKTGGIVWQLKEGLTVIKTLEVAVKTLGGILAVWALGKIPALLTSITSGLINIISNVGKLGIVIKGLALYLLIENINKIINGWDEMNTGQKILAVGISALSAAVLFLNKAFLSNIVSMGENIVLLGLYAKDAIVGAVSAIGKFVAAIWTKMITGIQAAIGWLGGLSAATWSVVGAFAGLAAAFLFLTFMDEFDAKTRIVVGSLMVLVGALTAAAAAWMAYHGAMTIGVAIPVILGAVAAGVAGIIGIVSGVKEIKGYASGGFPDKGELFIARENGAEMVGTMSNKTVVANNNQIVEGISSGVYNAVSSAMGSGGGASITVDFKNADDSALARLLVKPLKTAFKQQGVKVGV